MTPVLKAVGVVILLAVNVAASGYLGLFFCLSCSRITSAHLASRMMPLDWVYLAVRRASEGVLVAAVVGTVLALINRPVLAILFPDRKLLSWPIAGSPAIIIVLGAILGSLLFLVEKPFM